MHCIRQADDNDVMPAGKDFGRTAKTLGVDKITTWVSMSWRERERDYDAYWDQLK